MIVIVDYGVGNLFSLVSSFKTIGADIVVSGEKVVIEKADKIVLPGVGAFGDAIEKLKATGLDKVVVERAKVGVDLLGICLGMQLLFDCSYEYGKRDGLGLVGGEIVPFNGKINPELKIPHIGWNALKKTKESKLLRYVNDGDCVYFVHSYYAENPEGLIATAEYDIPVTACVEKGNVYGCQFHPEKSGEVGLNILRAFVEG
ncbi:MAG: imidazole glycerol phosphate synthase subunit HisH [Clostridia bacterium]|nr:imidazole glycerol phosphate synthase subunit HisH [Clostridia bacterium]